MAISRSDPDYVKADFVNYKLGGAFTGILNLILREEKGYTYGASSFFQEMKAKAPFIAATSVRTDATFESLKIMKDEMEKYRNGVGAEDLQFIKNAMNLSNALDLKQMARWLECFQRCRNMDFLNDYIKQDENVVTNMTIEEHKAITDKYIDPNKMYYVVVGDAATQLKPLEKTGIWKAGYW